jgi:hypothetical protein
VGLLSLPVLGVRWFVDGEDAGKDIEAAAVRVLWWWSPGREALTAAVERGPGRADTALSCKKRGLAAPS